MVIKIGVCASCGKAHDLDVTEYNREAQYADLLGGSSATRFGETVCPTTNETIYVYLVNA